MHTLAGLITPTAFVASKLTCTPVTVDLRHVFLQQEVTVGAADMAVAAIAAHAGEPRVQRAGVQALLGAAGCLRCGQQHDAAAQEALGAAGAVEALLGAITVTVGMPGAQPDGAAGGAEALQALQLLGARHSGPEAAAGLAEALQALQFCCLGHDGNIARMAVAGGLDGVRAAILAAGNLWAAQEHGAVLLALLGGRPDSTPAEMALCVRLLVDIAEQQLDKKCGSRQTLLLLACLRTHRPHRER